MTGPLPIDAPRLTIRRFRESDAAAFHGYRSDPAVARYQSWDPDDAIEDAVRFVSAVAVAPLVATGEWIQLAIDVDGALIGDLGVGFRRDPSVVEVGFTIAPAFQGNGYAAEAVAAIVPWLRSVGVVAVLAIVDDRNRASKRVVDRLGMSEISRESTVFKGEPCVEITFGLTI